MRISAYNTKQASPVLDRWRRDGWTGRGWSPGPRWSIRRQSALAPDLAPLGLSNDSFGRYRFTRHTRAYARDDAGRSHLNWPLAWREYHGEVC